MSEALDIHSLAVQMNEDWGWFGSWARYDLHPARSQKQTTMAKNGRTMQPLLFLWMVSMGSSLVTIPLVPHKVVRHRKLSAGERLPPKMERPHYSKYDQRFLQHEVPAEQVAGLYQGYGTVREVVIA